MVVGILCARTRLHRSPPATFKSPKATRGDLLEGPGRIGTVYIHIYDLPTLATCPPSGLSSGKHVASLEDPSIGSFSIA